MTNMGKKNENLSQNKENGFNVINKGETGEEKITETREGKRLWKCLRTQLWNKCGKGKKSENLSEIQ